MSDNVSSILDEIAVLEAQMDQAEAEINRARQQFEGVPYMEAAMAVNELHLESMRIQLEFARRVTRSELA